MRNKLKVQRTAGFLLCILCIILCKCFQVKGYCATDDLQLNRYSVNLSLSGVGSAFQLIPVLSAENGEYLTSFTSSDEAVARVLPNGWIEAVGTGTATVLVETSAGRQASAAVSVREMSLAELPENVKIVEENAFRGVNIERVIVPYGAEEIHDYAFAENENLQYISIPDSAQVIAENAFFGDSNICILCNKGSFAEQWAIEHGITHMLNDRTDDGRIQYISTPGDMTIGVGEELSVAVSIGPESAADKTVYWISSDSDVATVTEDGLIYGVGAGQTTITIVAADGSGVSASFILTVTGDEAVSFSVYNAKHFIGSTNAVLARTIRVNGNLSINDVTSVGCYIYSSQGILLGSKREKPTPKNGVINAWYDVNNELGVQLNKGETYRYCFVAVINGKDYLSDYDTFALMEYQADTDKIQAVIDRAYEWVNYTWTAPVDIPVYNNLYDESLYPAYYHTEYYFKAGTEMHGLPYTLSNSKYNLEKYEALSNTAKAASAVFTYSGVKMWGPKYAADCSELVSDCLYHGDPLIGTDGQTYFSSNKAYMYETVSWDQIAPGDALAKTGHTMIVVDVSADNITTVEQKGNGDDAGALHCTNVEARDGGGYYVCGKCEACKGEKKGATVLTTRKKSELSNYTIYRYLPLYQTSRANKSEKQLLQK